MRFSLIVATIERVVEMRELFESLTLQIFHDFEVIIVDQNPDQRLQPVVDEYGTQIKILWLRSTIRNNSHARNLGLAAATGEIVAFPDDDCLYPPTVLQHVDRAFNAPSLLAMLSGPSLSPSGKLGSGRWHTESGTPTMQTIWTSIIEFNLFIGTSWMKQVGGFDENLGVGAPFGSSEGVDLAIRIIKAGGRSYYDATLFVIHPDKALSRTAVSRAYRYGTGMGRVLRKHAGATGAKTIVNFAIRPAAGILLSLARANLLSASYYWQTLRGRVTGFASSLNH